jgi:hypothetical protein
MARRLRRRHHPFLGSLHEAHRTADILAEPRSAGLPVPRHELVLDIDDAVLIVQEYLPGSAPTEITPSVVDRGIRSRPGRPRIRLYRAINYPNGAVWSIADDLTSWTDDLCLPHWSNRLCRLPAVLTRRCNGRPGF